MYEEIFEEESISDELSKSRGLKVKKSKEDERFELSVSASKGFRSKTNTVVKSIKLAEELNFEHQKKLSNEKMQEKVKKGDKLAQEIIKEKANLDKIQSKIKELFFNSSKKQPVEANKDLLYRFKVEINRLLTA